MRVFFPYTIIPIVLIFCATTASAQHGGEKTPGPLPLLEPDPAPLTNADMQNLLDVLRRERDALKAEWQAISKGTAKPKNTDDEEIQRQKIARILDWLKNPPSALPKKYPEFTETPEINTKPDTKKTDTEDLPATRPEGKTPGFVVDQLSFGQMLFRVGKYSEALSAFEKLDVVGMAPEEKAPILFLKARCNVQLKENAKAKALFENVVNVRTDDALIDYARWELAQLHWHGNVNLALDSIRKRRKAAENAK